MLAMIPVSSDSFNEPFPFDLKLLNPMLLHSPIFSSSSGSSNQSRPCSTRQQLIDEKLTLERDLKAALEAKDASEREKQALEHSKSGLEKELTEIRAEKCELEQAVADLDGTSAPSLSLKTEKKVLEWFQKVKANLSNENPDLESEVDEIIMELGAQIDQGQPPRCDLGGQMMECLKKLKSAEKGIIPQGDQ